MVALRGDERLVAATGVEPERANITASASRVACEPITLVTARTVAPRSRGQAHRGEVSAVSPDWVMPIMGSRGRPRGRDSRSSDAMSISTGTRVHSSSA